MLELRLEWKEGASQRQNHQLVGVVGDRQGCGMTRVPDLRDGAAGEPEPRGKKSNYKKAK